MHCKIKLSAEEKIALVQKVLREHLRWFPTAKEMGIPESTLRMWIRNYLAIGPDAFSKRSYRHWTLQEKTSAVQDYLTGKGSLADICLKHKISATSTLRRWIKKYNGHKKPEKTDSLGGKIMTNGRKTTYEERLEIVKQCIESGYNYAETALKNKVSYQQVYSWVQKYRKGGVEALRDRRGKPKDPSAMTELDKLRAENRILKAEVKYRQMEIDFLKKLEEVERRRF